MANKKIPVAAMNINTLADGYAGRAIDSAISRVSEDILSRGDQQKRTVTIKLSFMPDDKGRCEIDVEASVRLPGYKPPKTVAKIDAAAGGLMFSPDASENPEQFAIPGIGNEED